MIDFFEVSAFYIIRKTKFFRKITFFRYFSKVIFSKKVWLWFTCQTQHLLGINSVKKPQPLFLFVCKKKMLAMGTRLRKNTDYFFHNFLSPLLLVIKVRYYIW